MMEDLRWRPRIGRLPLGPVTEQLTGPEYTFVLGTVKEWARAGIDLRGLRLDGWRQRGSPVCYEHDHAIIAGRCLSLTWDGDTLIGTMQFIATPFGERLRAEVAAGRLTAASLSIDGDHALLEWSVVAEAADRSAKLAHVDVKYPGKLP
jgi:hypothetical protein